MKTMRVFGLSLLCVLILASVLRTQDGNAQTATPVPSASPQSAPSAEKIALVEELLGLLHTQETVNISVDKIFGTQKDMAAKMGLSPEMQAQQMKVMESVMGNVKKIMNWDTIKNDYIQVYANAFTEDELRGLIAFFKTPLGQAYIQKQPGIQDAMAQKVQGQMLQLLPQIQSAFQQMMPGKSAPSPAAPQASPATGP